MMDVSAISAFSKALHNRLSTHLTVQSVLGDPARLHDQVPEDPVFPYLTYGAVKAEDKGGDGASVTRLSLTLHIWSRYAGRAEVTDIVSAINTALNGDPLRLEDGRSVGLSIPVVDILRAPDGRTLHGFIRVNGYVCAGALA